MPDDKLTPHKTTAASMRCVLKERVGHLYLFRVAGTTRLIPVRVTDFWGATEGETMTTIPSTHTTSRTLEISNTDNETVLKIRQGDALHAAIFVRTTDLHRALGIDELGCGCDEADQNLTAAIHRAETAEAVRDEYKAKAEWLDGELSAVKANRDHIVSGFQEHVARAAGAEDTIARIREALADPRQGYPAIHNILNPTPPFELPTTVPARVTAKRHDGEERTFYLWTNGTDGTNDNLWIDEDNWWHALTGGELMEGYTDHRVLDGAA